MRAELLEYFVGKPTGMSLRSTYPATRNVYKTECASRQPRGQ
jgi:hypothetical protein